MQCDSPLDLPKFSFFLILSQFVFHDKINFFLSYMALNCTLELPSYDGEFHRLNLTVHNALQVPSYLLIHICTLGLPSYVCEFVRGMSMRWLNQ